MTALVLLLGSALAQSPAPGSAPAPVSDAPAPAIPRLSRQEIADCGCALYAPPGMSFDPPTLSQDGSRVWQGQVELNGWRYGIIAVRFAEPQTASSPAELEDMLVSYLQFLQSQLGVRASAGVGRGHTRPDNPGARGVIDYWQDAEGRSWAVKGWVDAQHLAVLTLSGNGEYPWFNLQQMYLDGFRSP